MLNMEDINKLYDSALLFKHTPRDFMTRLLSDVAFMTGCRPTEMESIQMKDVTSKTDRKRTKSHIA